MVTSDAQEGVFPGGKVSISGYVDGMYELRVKYNIFNEVAGVMIDFGEEE